MSQLDYTTDEMMTVEAARQLKDEDVCFVGIGLPSAAANLARLTHAPEIVLIYEIRGPLAQSLTCSRSPSATASSPTPLLQ